HHQSSRLAMYDFLQSFLELETNLADFLQPFQETRLNSCLEYVANVFGTDRSKRRAVTTIPVARVLGGLGHVFGHLIAPTSGVLRGPATRRLTFILWRLLVCAPLPHNLLRCGLGHGRIGRNERCAIGVGG